MPVPSSSEKESSQDTPTAEAGTALPRHIAIIMDGNRRWAKGKHLPTLVGHKQGVDALSKIVRYASDEGVQALTVYAFSTENWNRTKEEVGYLMGLFVTALTAEINDLHKNNVRIRFIGDLSELPKDVSGAIEKAHQLTANNTGIRFQVATNYGGRAEILRACQNLATRVQAGELSVDAIDEAAFESELYTHDVPPLDLMIRTGGEYRVSNYLLWQFAYAELFVTQTLWPDFSPDTLDEAIATFQKRDRRYGK